MVRDGSGLVYSLAMRSSNGLRFANRLATEPPLVPGRCRHSSKLEGMRSFYSGVNTKRSRKPVSAARMSTFRSPRRQKGVRLS